MLHRLSPVEVRAFRLSMGELLHNHHFLVLSRKAGVPLGGPWNALTDWEQETWVENYRFIKRVNPLAVRAALLVREAPAAAPRLRVLDAT